MLVQNRGLLVIAAIVWLIAGVNVFIVGLNAGYASWDVPLIAGTSVVFVVFLLMFLRITQRNATRLTAHGNERSSIIWFMDGRSYLVMAFMIALGIGLRLLAPVPSGVIAFFYTGLGCALAVAGVAYVAAFIFVDLAESAQRLSPVIVWSFVFSLGVLLEFIGRSLEHVGIPFAPMASSMLSVVVGVAGYLLWIRSNNASKAGKATEATEAAEAGTGTGDAAVDAAAAAGSASKARNGLLIITLGATMLVASFMLKQLIPLVLG